MAVKRARKPMKTKQAVVEKQEDDNSDDVYDVEKILDRRESATQGTLYYVKWRNYPSHHNTWEPASNILNNSLIEAYTARVAKANKTKTSTPLRSSRKTTTKSKSNLPTKTGELDPEDEPNMQFDKIDEDDEDLKQAEAPEVDIEMESNEPEEDEKELAKETEEDEKEEDEEAKDEEDELNEEPAKPLKRQRTASKPKITKSLSGKKPVPEPKPKKAPAVRKAPLRGRKVAVEPVAAETSKTETPKTEVSKTETSKIDTPTEIDFQKFKASRVINESSDSKTITFLGKYNGKDTVVMLERTVFDETITKKALIDKELLSNRDFINDIYSSYKVTLPESPKSLNQIKATVIHPATNAVIAKYSGSETSFFSETSEVYSKVVEPFINDLLESDEDPNRWVYNILEGKSEADRVLYDDKDSNSGFMLVESIKNSSSTTEDKGLELLAICHRRDIRSLRDLNDKHLTLLRNILTKGTQILKDKYKKSKGEFRSYVHYHPSFYHFHVHFKMVDLSSYRASDRDHLLSTIINNITINKLYYKKSTLTYPISHLKALYLELEKAKRV